MTTRRRHDDGILGDAFTPDRWGSATGGWRENLVVLGTGVVLDLVRRPEIASRLTNGGGVPCLGVVSGICSVVGPSHDAIGLRSLKVMCRCARNSEYKTLEHQGNRQLRVENNKSMMLK